MASYRYTGEAAAIFPGLTAGIEVADPEDGQVPGELRPGQSFGGPDGLKHPDVEVVKATKGKA